MRICYLSEEELWFDWSQVGESRRQLHLPEGKQEVGGRLLPASELLEVPELPRYWRQLIEWTDSLLRRQRWLPLLQPAGEALQAYRMPCWDDEEDARIFQHLLQHMPGCALFPWNRPRSALARMLDLILEALAQRRLNEEPALKLPRGWPEEARSWAEAHAGWGEAPLTRSSLRLAQELLAWSRAAHAAQGAWRTCFTLVEPATEDEPWRLDFALQSRAQSSLWLEAELVWNGEAAELARMAGLPLENPAEQLLVDLGRAARFAPEIAIALQQARPVQALLDLEGARSFLGETAWLLEDSGFGVRLPVRHRPRLRLRTSPSAPAGGAPGLDMQRIARFDWQLEVDGQPLSLAELRRLARSKQGMVRSRGRWIMLDRESARQLLRAVEQPPGPLGEALHNLPQALDERLIEIDTAEVLESLHNQAEAEKIDPPAALQAQLRPYQERGYAWLAFLGARGLGACLADDMGLGKTIQLLSWLLRARELDASLPALLICPTSVLGNWQREIARFSPDLPVCLYYGPGRALEIEQGQLVLTSYSLLQRDREILQPVTWSTLALDEAQNIKNSAALQSRAARSLQAKFRVALTGTPVENRLGELWSIMDFLNPGLLGSQAGFQRRFARPIEREGAAEPLQALQRLVRPFLLRRLKSDPKIVPDLPAKQESKVFCPLTSEQASLYAAVLEEALQQLEKKEGTERKGLILKLLLQLKQVCNHPAQFLADRSPLAGRSGKLLRLEEMLAELLEAGQAALVFTQFAGWGARLADFLRQRFGVPVDCLHGGVKKAERDAMVAEFQRDGGPPLLVLSLKAGGVGLNLTRASRVFHYDRWWNPAVENQATDRAYRIGQQQRVQVYKFMAEGTLEEAIDQLIERKSSLAENVLGGDESWLTELDDRALRDLLTLRGGSQGETQSPLERRGGGSQGV